MPFRWTVNPYRGCEFGCKYCYARYTHEYMELDGGEFETKIYVKKDSGRWRSVTLPASASGASTSPIGTATDPYQPAEKEFGATRAILERMAEREGLSLSITTKSNQVLRDVDLLQKISAKSALSVNLSITTLKTRLARMLEPRAPSPDLRLDAVRQLRKAGIAAGVLAMPVLPGLTDTEEDLDALARGVSEAGAQWLGGQCAFPHAGVTEAIPAFSQGEISEVIAALSGMVRAQWIRARIVSQGIGCARREAAAETWPLRSPQAASSSTNVELPAA